MLTIFSVLLCLILFPKSNYCKHTGITAMAPPSSASFPLAGYATIIVFSGTDVAPGRRHGISILTTCVDSRSVVLSNLTLEEQLHKLFHFSTGFLP
jgi:hypothetical protein